MSALTIKVLIAGALLLHGLDHGGALGALIWIGRRGESDTGGWLAARSRLPMFNTLAALGMNIAVLVTQLWRHWPPQTMFGK